MKKTLMWATWVAAWATAAPAFAEGVATTQTTGTVVVSTTTTATTTPPPPRNAGAYAALPPGGQKIADSLYRAELRDAPTATTSSGRTVKVVDMTKDDIAAAKKGEGWGRVFKDMKSEGLVTEKNLGQAIKAGRTAPTTASGSGGPAATHRHTSPVVISYGNGATSVADTGRHHAGGDSSGHRYSGSTTTTTGQISHGGGYTHGHSAGAVTTVSAAGSGTSGHGGGHGKH